MFPFVSEEKNIYFFSLISLHSLSFLKGKEEGNFFISLDNEMLV